MTCIDEEESADFCQQPFWHTIEQHETDARPNLWLLEEGYQRLTEFVKDAAHRFLHFLAIFRGTWQCPAVVEPQGNEESCHEVEHKAPRVADVARDDLQGTCQADKQS